ncbi:hypothetical protein FOMG_19116 [Fusarium oxysporum f. sp. melonis 26406]|uniref:Uncharacterized protein n=2 Tax=Fusarium oxysporum TaxID=5507 RepID=A0A2H3FRG7_FUSOX|nr:hypothetical protein FOMG_19116 [Fusarium oxysporum f. sp. melonis 26406]PCD22011.1 hypothetical protein AU210_015813 [Fusarium oxysporum f. sp. radicis-cucumerinum]
MKPVFISIASMALLASATPIISDTSSSLQVRGNDESDIVLEKRAMAAMNSNILDKRTGRHGLMQVPNSVGTAVKTIGFIIVKAIVNAAGDLVFQITNNGGTPYKVSFRESGTMLDAGNPEVASHHTIDYDPLGGIKRGDTVSITTQMLG